MYTNLIIDGSNIEHRMFYISNKGGTDYDQYGNPVGCIQSFLLSFKKFVAKFQPTNIYVCWDKKLTWPSTNFRNELLDNTYKGTRIKPDNIREMYDQEPKIIEVLRSLGCKCLFPNVLEGDDIISWLAQTRSGSSVIISVDQDLLQLINDHVTVFNPGSKIEITPTNFEEIVGVKQDAFKVYKALLGDASDNIVGLRGYGKVRSKRLAEKWGEVNVTDDIKELVEKNLKIIDLSYGYTVHTDEIPCYERQLDEQKELEVNMKKFEEVCKKHDLNKILGKLSEWKTLFCQNKVASLIESYFANINI